MRVDRFDFVLPPHLVAQRPAEPRDAARLLRIGADGAFDDRRVADLPDILRPGDLLVLNDTRVMPVRLSGRRGEAAVEVTLLETAGGGRWQAMVRPASKLAPGDTVAFADDFAARVEDKGDGGAITFAFEEEEPDFRDKLVRHGAMPLPPYIRRPRGGDPRDRADYQTMFAREDGAVAAPTAALHFTPRLVGRLLERGIGTSLLTLHVGAGTFLPVKADDTADHVMHEERYALPPATVDAIDAARARGGRIVAVGTTVLRTLESVATDAGELHPAAGSTRLFVTPGHRFRVVDLLMTNFHLPRSTLFMLVAAFAGLERMHAAYGHAIGAGYRFYSYGDASLIERPR
jgi:S-adenosylmethionine:tRNA ribosyltransferase-isomerase